MRTAVCIASGASLTRQDAEYCKGRADVYAVKECWRQAPFASVMYAADTDWFEQKDRWQGFKGAIWTCSSEAAKKYGLNHIDYKPQEAWSFDQSWIATGGNSGFQALNLAVLHGAERVILLGYDMGVEEGQKKHWWDDEYPRQSRVSNYKDWIKKFNKAAPLIPVPVLNASRRSALTCFPMVELCDVL